MIASVREAEGPHEVSVTGTVRRTLQGPSTTGSRLVLLEAEDGRWWTVRGTLSDEDLRARSLTVWGTPARGAAGVVLHASRTWRGPVPEGPSPPLGGLELLMGELFRGHGFGPATARRVIEAFGPSTWEVLTLAPLRMASVVGGAEKATALHGVLLEEGVSRTRELARLMDLGLSLSIARKALDRMGEEATSRLKADPYGLMQLPGIRFRAADQIARRRMGVSLHDSRRHVAALVGLLQDAADAGHTSLPEKEVLASLAASLGPITGGETGKEGEGVGLKAAISPGGAQRGTEDLGEIIDRAVAGGRTVRDRGDLYLPRYHAAEERAAQGLATLIRRKRRPVALRRMWASSLPGYTAAQRRAIRYGLTRGVSLITGRPGTGKSRVARGVVRIARETGVPVTLTATTTKAAQGLAEIVLGGRAGEGALEYQGDLFVPEAPPVRAQTVQSLVAGRASGRSLPPGIVIVDEASMIDLPLMARIVSAAGPETSLMLLGDPEQLPPVLAGASARDMRGAGVVPTVELDVVHRQRAGSLIRHCAEHVLRGEVPPLIGTGKGAQGLTADAFFVDLSLHPSPVDLVLRSVERLMARGFHPLRDLQVYTPMHRGSLGTRRLNEALQAKLNPGGEETGIRDAHGLALRVGDPVLQIRNDEARGVPNGSRGVVSGRTPDGGLTVRFRGRDVSYPAKRVGALALAYASTIHKGQGQEHRAVVLCLDHRQHHPMLDRALLYVGLTRATELFVCVGTPAALRIAARTDTAHRRHTRLATRTARELRRLRKASRDWVDSGATR